MLTKNNKVVAVKELNWGEAVNALMSVNHTLATIMNKLKTDTSKYTFYLAKYPFGHKIIDNKKTFLALENGESIAFDDPQLPDALRDNLRYDSAIEDPLGVVLNKSSEFYLLGENRIQPHSIIMPGQIFGTPRAIDNSPTTSSVLELTLNAGARSVFMLPKISDQVNHRKLQDKYGIKSLPPALAQEHWNIFVELNRKANNPWYSEVIYFPRNWIRDITTEEWAILEVCLMQMHRKSYSILHRAAQIWDKVFHEIEQKNNLGNFPMQSLKAAKQLIKISADVIPGFRPATNDESAPISLLTEMYSTTYNKLAKPKYSPIIMEPCKFSLQNGAPVYDSLNYATFSENHLDSSKKKSHISLLQELRIINGVYLQEILKNKVSCESLYEVVKNVNFSYYHTNPENYTHIKNALLLADEDQRFCPKKGEDFANNASFFKGCIKISKEK